MKNEKQKVDHERKENVFIIFFSFHLIIRGFPENLLYFFLLYSDLQKREKNVMKMNNIIFFSEFCVI